MARIRSIKPEFYRNLKLYHAEVESGLPLRVAFSGLWCVCDREGRFKWRPEELKLDVLPFDPVDFSPVLDALFTRGYLVKYRVGEEFFGWVPTWKEHQIINNRESESKLPDVSMADEVIHASTTREPRDTDLLKGKGREGEREGKGIQHTLREENSDLPALVPSSLFTDLRNAFQSKNPMWAKPEVQVEALTWLVKAFVTLNPESPESTAQIVLEGFYKLIEESPESFWRRQPFTPSGLRSLWDRVLAELKAQAGAQAPTAEDDGSWVNEMGGKA